MDRAVDWLGWLAMAMARMGRGRPGIVLAIAGIISLACLIHAWASLRFLTSRHDMISPSKEVQRRWKAHLARVGGTEDDMVVVFAGENEEAMRPAVEDLAACLRDEPGRFRRVWHEADLRPIADRALQLAPAEKLAAILGQVRSMRPLLELPLAWNLFTLQNLVYETRMRLKGVTSEADLSRRDRASRKPGAEADATVLDGFILILESAAASLRTGKLAGSPWPADDDPRAALLRRPGLLSAPGGKLAFVLASPVPDESNKLDANKASVARLRAIVEQVHLRHPGSEIGVTGLPVLENDEMEASQADTTRSSWIAFAGVLGLYVFVFRTWRAPLISAIPLLVGTIMALGWATLTVGHLNLLSATFAVMLIGMGDYSVLYVSRYLSELSSGALHEEALDVTAGSLGASIATAALTSSLAFMAALLSDFRAVAELGWIAGWGLVFCAGSALAIVPALLSWLKPLPPPCPEPSATVSWNLPALAPLAALFAAICAIGMSWLRYDHNLLRLQSPSLPSVAWEHRLLEATPGASWHALVWAENREEALHLKGRLESLPEVSMVTEVASLISPPGDPASSREVGRLLERLPPGGARFQHPKPNPDQLTVELTKLREVLRDGPPPDEPRLGKLLAAAGDLESAIQSAGTAASPVLGLFDDALADGLLERLHELKSISGTAPITLADVPAPMRERHADAEGRFLLRVFARAPLWESENLKRFNDAVLSVAPGATGKPFTTWEGLVGMRAGFTRAGILALLAIVVVLAADFRSISCVLLALVPLAVGTAVSLGVFGWLGWPLNPANMIALPLIVGVGVDNGVHVVHDWRACRGDGPYRMDPGTARGILVAGMTTVIGFGALMVSDHRGLAGLGAILALGVGGSLVTALVVLPRLLSAIGDSRAVAGPAILTGGFGQSRPATRAA